ncbi:MAG: YDG domain-containing protein [Betaproteobacteria bacterium]
MHRPPPAPPRLKPLAQALIAASLLSVWPGIVPAQANPVGATALPGGLNVAAGQAQLAVQGAQMTVRNTPGAILNWQRFDIGASAGVHFEQANAASKVLNRVVGNDPSQILGRLSSNGQVWLLNPNGVLFGQGARVDVAGLLAGSMRMLDSDFLAGRYRLNAPEAGGGALAGSVVNHGQLGSRFGGQILLVGSRVENTGEVSAPGGHVGLVAGRSVELVDTGLPNLSVKVTVPDDKAEVANLGRLASPGGRIDVYAGIVNQRGLAEAQSLSVGANGEIVLQASDTLILDAGSRTRAVGSAEGSSGGRIDLVAPQVGLVGDAEVDASGAASGGSVRIGGGLRGQETDIPNARAVYLGEQARVRADGGTGDGGRIVLWSDEATRGHGTLSARGGAQGQGGFVEVSSKGVLAWTGHADLGVADGDRARYGTLLLDPEFIVIRQGSPSIDGSGSGDLASPSLLFGAFAGATSIITSGAINTQLLSANVVLQANKDITVEAGLATPISGPRNLTLQAGENIVIGSPITVGSLTLSANDPSAPGARTGTGAVTVNAPLTATTGAAAITITHNGGSGTHAIGAEISTSMLTVTGGVALSTPATWTLSGASSVSGVLGGAGALTKAGTGTLTIGGGAVLGSVAVNGGQLALDGSSTLGTLTLGGTDPALGGSGTVTVTGSFTASGNSALLRGTGTLLTPAGSTSSIDLTSAGGSLSISEERRWLNAGTVTLGGDDRLRFTSGAGPTFVNQLGGVFDIQSSNAGPITMDSGAQALFSNAGTLNKNASGPQSLSLMNGGWVGNFSNTGTVNINAGALNISGNGTDSGAYAMAAGATLEFSGGTRTLAAASNPAGGTGLTVSGGTLTLELDSAPATLLPITVSGGTFSVNAGGSLALPALSLAGGTLNLNAPSGLLSLPASLTVSGATLNLVAPAVSSLAELTLTGTSPVLGGSATLTVTGSFTASGTAASLRGSGTLITPAGSTTSIDLSATGADFAIQDSQRWLNAGTVTLGGDDRLWFSFSAFSSLTPTFVNQAGGVFNITSTNPMPVGMVTGVYPVFTNAGTLNKTAAGAQALNLQPAGTGWVGEFSNTGTVNISAGTLRIQGSGTDTGAYAMAAGTAIEFGGTRTLAKLPAGGASMTVGVAGLTTNLTANSADAGTTLLPTTVLSGSSLTVNASGNLAVASGGISNAGTVSLNAAGDLTVPSLAQSAGSASLSAGNAVGVTALSLSGSTLSVASTSGAVGLPGVLTVDNATLNISSPFTTTFSSLTLTGASSVLGGSGTVAVTGTLTANGAAAALRGNGTLLTPAGSTSNIDLTATGGSFSIADNRRWLNAGTVTLGGDDRLFFAFSSSSTTPTFVNQSGGVFDIASTHATPVAMDGSIAPVFTNAGTLNKNATGTQTLGLANSFWVGNFSNTGTVNVNAGSLTVLGSGTDTGNYVVAAGSGIAFAAGARTLAAPPVGAASIAVDSAGAATSVTIAGSGAATALPAVSVSGSASFTVNASGNLSVASLSSSSTGAVALNAGGTLSVPSVSVTAGTANLTAAGALSVPSISLTGGTLGLASTFDALALPSSLTVSGAVLNISSPTTTSFANLTLTGASPVLGGSGTVAVTGAFTANGVDAYLRGAGTLLTPAGSSSSINLTNTGGALYIGDDRRWLNAGTITLGGDDRLLFARTTSSNTPNFVNQPSGVFDIASSHATPVAMDCCFFPVFTNAGTLNKNAAGTQTLGMANSGWGGTFNNTGVVNVNAGTLNVWGSGVDTGSYVMAPGSGIGFAAGTRTLSAAPIGAASIAVDAAASVTTIVTISGSGPATTLPAVTVAGGASLTVNAGGNLSVASLASSGSGTVSLNAGGLLSVPSVSLSAGTANLTSANDLSVPSISLTGGTLGLASTFGAITLPGSLTVNNAGLNISSPSTTTFTNLTLSGASAALGGSGTVAVTGALTANGDQANLRGSGTLLTPAGSTTSINLAASGGSLRLSEERRWLNAGTVTLGGDDQLRFEVSTSSSTPGSFTNQPGGVFNIDTTNATPLSSPFGQPLFTNAGTLNKNAPGTQTFGLLNGGWIGSFSNTGTVNLNAGTLSVLAYGSGTDTGSYAMAAGTAIEFGGVRTLGSAPSGGASMAIVSVPSATTNFTITGSGASTALLPTTVAAATTLTVNASGNLGLPSLSSGGTVALSAGGALSVPSLTVTAGTASLSAGGDLSVPALSLGAGSTLSLSSTTGALSIPASLSLGAARLNLSSPVETVLASLALSGTTLGGSGSVRVTGATTVGGSANSALANTLTLTTDGTTTIDLATAGGALVLGDGAHWINAGTANLNGDDRLLFSAITTCCLPTRFTNRAGATFNLNSSAARPIENVGSGVPAFTNAGLLRKTGSTSQVIDLSSSFTGTLANEGTWRIDAGSLTLDGTLTQSGTVQVAAGATLATQAGFTNAATGLIGGAGTLRVGSSGTGTLTNLGTLQPGSASLAGTLSVQGNVDFGPASTLAVRVGGSIAGASDRLAVTGNVSMAGRIDATLANGYTPATGDFVPVLTASGTRSGLFAAVTGASGLSAGYGLAAGEAVRLIFAAADGLPSRVFSNAAGDLNWSNPANWGGALPGSGDTAVLSSGFAVTHAAGTTTVGGLRVNAANALAVTGGSFTVSYDSRIDGSVAVSGTGALRLAGPVSGSGSLAVGNGRTLTVDGSGAIGSLALDGVLDGAGALRVDGSFSATGSVAQLRGSGTLVTPTGSTSTINLSAAGGSFFIYDNRRWLNAGTATLGGDERLYFGHTGATGQAPTFVNEAGGVFNLGSSAATPVVMDSGDLPVFGNAGTFNKTAPGQQTLNLFSGSFSNTGTVNVNAGTLSLNANGTDTGTYQLAPGTVLALAGGTRTLPGSALVMGSGARLSVSGGQATLALSGAATLPPVTVSGGVLDVTTTGSLTATGYELTGGTLNLGSPGRPLALGTSDLALTAGTLGLNSDVTLSSLSLQNATLAGSGAVTVTGGFTTGGNSAGLAGTGVLRTQGATTVGFTAVGGRLRLDGGRSWLNSGTITITGDDGLSFAGTPTLINQAGASLVLAGVNTSVVAAASGGTLTLRNAGTLSKTSSGAQTIATSSSFGLGLFENTGSVQVQAGTLGISAGGSDTGSYQVAAGAALEFAGGTRTLAPASNPAGGGSLRVSGGSVTLSSAGGLALLPLGLSGGDLFVDTNGGLTLPSLTASGGNLVASSIGATTIGSLSNSGATLGFTADPLNVGTLSLTGGSTTLQTRVSALALPDTLTISGGRLNLSAPETTTFAALTLTGTAPVLGGSGTVAVTGSFTANGTSAELRDSGTLLTPEGATSTVNLSAAGASFIVRDTRRWINTGTVNFGGDDRLLFASTGSGATPAFLNQPGGVFNLSSTHVAPVAMDCCMTPVFTNAGTFNKSAAGTQSLGLINSASGDFSNTGVVNVLAGTLRILANGTDTGAYTLAAGAGIDFAGGTRTLSAASNPTGGSSLAVSGSSTSVTLNGAGSTTLLPLSISGGGRLTVNSPGNVAAGSLTLTDGGSTLTVNGSGGFSVPVASVTGGSLLVTTTGDIALPALTLANANAWLDSRLGAITLPSSLTVDGANLHVSSPVPTTLASLALTGNNPVLGGSGTVTVTGGFTANGNSATLEGSGTLVTAAGSTSNINLSAAAGSFRINDSRRWLNAGTATLGGDDRLFFSYSSAANLAPTFVNQAGGVFNLSTTHAAPMSMDCCVSPVFTNAGTFNKTAAGAQELNLNNGGWTGSFNNTGTLNLNAGTLTVAGNGTDTGAYAMASGTGLVFAVGTRTLSSASNPAGGSSLTIAGANVTLNGTGASTSLLATTVSSGSLTVNAANTLSLASLAMTGGTATLSAAGSLSVPVLSLAGATLNLSSAGAAVSLPATLTLNNAALGISSPVTTTFTSLTLSGANPALDGSGTVAVTGVFTASGNAATLRGSGTLLTPAGSTSTINLAAAGGSFRINDSRRWLNAGTVTLGGDDRLLFGYTSTAFLAPVFVNQAGGVFNLGSSHATPVDMDCCVYPVFSNAGTLNKTAGGTQTFVLFNGWAGNFSNTGTVNVAAGTLRVQGAGTDTGVYSLAAGTGLAFGGGTRTLAQAPVGGAALGIFTASSGATNVTLNAVGAATALPATTVEGSASFTVNASGNLSLPSLTSSSTGQVRLGAGGAISVPAITVSAGTVSLAATQDLTASTLGLTGGTLNLGSTLGALVLPASLTLSNATLNLDAATTTTFAGLAFTGASPALGGSGTVVVTGALTASGAAAAVGGSGTLITPAGSTTSIDLSVAGGSFSVRDSRRWLNAGTVNLGGDDRLFFAYTTSSSVSPAFVNEAGGVFNIGSTHASPVAMDGGLSPVFTNAGTLNKNAGGTQALSLFNGGWLGRFNNTGTLNLNAGLLSVLGDGTDTGAYVMAAGTGLEFATGTRTLAVAPSGGATLAVGSASTVTNLAINAGGPTTALPATTVTGNSTTFTVNAGGNLNVASLSKGGTGSATIRATGSLGLPSVSVSAGSASLSAGSDLSVSSLSLTGGALDLDAPLGVLSLPGSVTVSNAALGLSSATATTLSNLTLTGTLPILRGSGTMTVTGSFTANGSEAALDGNGTLITAAGSTSSINLSTTGGAFRVRDDRRWLNAGTVNLSGDDSLVFGRSGGGSPSPMFVNQAGGVVNLDTSSATPVAMDCCVFPVFTNAGTLNKNAAGAQTLNLVNSSWSGSFVNTGTVSLGNGTLSIAGPVSQSGVLDIPAGRTLSFDRDTTNGVGGVIRGSGTLRLGTGANTLTNLGVLQPGGAGTAGTLTVNGNLLMSGGALRADIGGTAAGSHDVLSVTGTATLGGTLTANLIGGYTPAVGHFAPVLAVTGTSTGTFAVLNGAAGYTAGYRLAAGEAARLIFGGGSGTVGGVTAVFTNASGGLDWTLPGNWSTGALPGLDDEALISSGWSVTHGSGNTAIASLTVSAGNALSVTGGSFSVFGATTLGGSFSLSGSGSATLSGPVSGGGSVSVSGGRRLVMGGSATLGAVAVSTAGSALQLDGNATLASLALNGGGLDGRGDITVAGAMNVTGPNSSLGGSATLTTQGATRIAIPGSAYSFDVGGGRSWVNTGTLTIDGDDRITLGIGTPGRLVNAAGGTVLLAGSSATPLTQVFGSSFDNAGTLHKTGAGSQTLAVSGFNHSGALLLDTGTLVIGGGAHTGTTTLAYGSTLGFSAGSRLIAGASLPGGGGGLSVSGADLQLDDGGLGAVTLPALTVTSGSLRVRSSGSLSVGALSVSGSSTTADIRAATDLNVASLALTGGSLQLGASGSASLPSALSVSSATLTLDTPTQFLGSLTLSGAKLAGTADIDVDGDFTVTGFASSTIVGTGAFRTYGSTRLEMAGSGTQALRMGPGRAWTNSGSMTISGESQIVLGHVETGDLAGGGGRLVNDASGTIALAGSSALPFVEVRPSVLDNFGTLRKTSSSTQTVALSTFNTATGGSVDVGAGVLRLGSGGDSGTTFVAPGAALEIHAGARRYGGSSLPGGSGALRVSGGTLTLDSSSGDTYSPPPLSVTGGTLNLFGDAAISIDALAFTGGQVNVDAATAVSLPSLSLSSTALRVRAGTGVSLPSTVNVSGTTLELTTPSVTFGSLRLNNGTISGATDVTVNGALDITGSASSLIGGSGSFVTNGTTTLDIPGAVTNLQVAGGRTWTNNGTLVIGGDDGIQLGVDGSGRFVNASGATIVLSGGATSAFSEASASSFVNNGSIQKTGTATQSLAVSSFTQDGSLSILAGTLRLQGGSGTGATAVSAGAVLDFASGSRSFSGSALPSGAGTLRVSGGSVTLDDFGSNLLGTLPITLSSGTLVGRKSGALTLSRLTNGGGSASFEAAAIAVTDLSLTGGITTLQSTSTVELPSLNLSGSTLDVRAVTGLVLPATANLSSASTLALSGPPVGFSTLNLSGSTLGGTSDVTVSGGFSVVGTVASAVTGSGTLRTLGATVVDIAAAGGQLTVAGSRPWVNEGSLQVRGSSRVLIGSGSAGSFTNAPSGSITLLGSENLALAAGTSGSVFSNQGTLTKSGTATQRLDFETFNHSGSLVVDGGTLELRGGVHTGTASIAGGATLALTGGVRNMVGSAVPTGLGRLRVSSGDLSLSDVANASILPPLTVTGGTLVVGGLGALTLPDLVVTGGSSAVATAGNLNLSALTLGGGSLQLSAGATATLPVLSLASTTLNVSAGLGIDLSAGATLVSSTLNLSAPSATVSALNMALSSLGGTGDITVTGSLAVSGSGASTLGGSGTLRTEGTTTLDISGAGTLNVAGARRWVNAGTLSLPGDDGIVLGTGGTGGTLINAPGGSIALSGSNPTPISQSTASTLRNEGTLTKSGSSTQTVNLGSLVNTGTLMVDGGTLALAGPLTQSGVIGTATGAVLQTSGSFVNAPGAVIQGTGTLRLGAGGTGTLANAGTLRPGASPGTTFISGNLDLTGGTLEIELGGTNVGVESDLIQVSGNVVLGGTLKAVLFGQYVPADADAIPFIRQVGTSTGLFSGLDIPQGATIGYRLAAGESARAIFSSSGTTKVFTNAAGDLNWNNGVNWGGTVPGALDEALISAGFAVSHASGTNSITTLTLNSANALDVSGGSLLVSGVTTLGGSLRVSGTGSVRLGGALTGGGQVEVAGSGLLQLGPTSTVAGLALSGGTLSGGGSLVVDGSFSRSPAAIVSGSFNSLAITQASGPLRPGAWSVVDGPIGLRASAGALTLDGVLSADTLSLRGSAGVTFESGGQAVAGAGSGDAIVVESGAAFTNLAGSGALQLATSGTRRWLVYSADPAADNAGGLAPTFRQYAATLGVTPVLGTGSGFLHALAPTLTVDLTGSVSKVYDRSTAASLAGVGVAFGGLGASDQAVLISSLTVGSFDNRNAGSGKMVSASGLTVAISDAVGGFPVFGVAYDGSARGAIGTITPAPLAVGGLAGGTRVYDATTNAPVSGTASVTPLVGDTVTVAGLPSAVFADKNVGSGKPIVIAGLSLDGADAANYTAVAPAGLTGSITRAALPVSGLVAGSRVYDATTVAPVSGTGAISPLGSDAVSLAGTVSAVFADKNVGTAKAVALSGLTLTGADAGNYDLTLPTTLSADITARPLPLLGLTAGPRAYDGTTVAPLSGTPGVAPLAGDAVSLAGAAIGSFATRNVGTAKPVTVSGLSLAGADAGNYVLQLPATLTANVSPAPLSLSAVAAADKVYDRLTAATIAGTLGGVFAGDSVGAVFSGRFASADAGAGLSVDWTALLSGADAANYALLNAAGSTSGRILPATLTYAATRVTAVAGSPLLLGGTVEGFVAGQTLATATTGSLLWTTPATLASPAGRYAIEGSGLSARNYVFVQAPGNADALTLTLAFLPTSPASITTSVIGSAVAAVTLPRVFSTPTFGRVLDVTPTLDLDGGFGFRRINTAQMTRDEIAAVLAARASYKRRIFADSLSRLEQDPTLADARACRDEREIQTGSCLVTEALIKEIQALREAARQRAEAEAAAQAQSVVQAAAQSSAQATGQVQPVGRVRVIEAALPVIERKFALVIGINKYRDRRIPELLSAVNDAQGVGRSLEQRFGYETEVLPDATREELLRALNRLAVEARPGDSVVIYYAGHGVLLDDKQQGFWLPADADADQPASWMSNADINRLVGLIPARQLLLVSDSCFSGQLVGSERVQVASGTDASTLLGKRAAVVMSSGGDEPVSDEGRDGHSVFTWHLLQRLNSVDAWRPGSNVFETLRDAVRREFPQTPQYGAARAAGHEPGTDYLYERRVVERNAPQPTPAPAPAPVPQPAPAPAPLLTR